MTEKKLPAHLYREILENLHEGVYFVDPERCITFWNQGAERISGYSAEQVSGHFCFENLLNHITENGTQLCTNGCPLLWTMRDGKPRQANIYLRHANGYRVPVSVRAAPLFDEEGNIIGAVETFSETTSKIATQRRILELEKEILRDPLTEIGNRRYLEIKLASALREYHQHKLECGILFIDTDHFKPINDQYGHITGDDALKIISSTMQHNLRDTDAFGRWGGDEFLAILFGIDKGGLRTIAEKLMVLVANARLTAQDKTIKLTISIGATTIRADDTAEALIERADHLMYYSKQSGGNALFLE